MLNSFLVIIILLTVFCFAGASADETLLPDSCDNILPGDVNSDGLRNYSDALVLKWFLCYGGDAPDPLANGDANGDCIIDWDDVHYIVAMLNNMGQFHLDCTCVEPDIEECPDSCANQRPGDANYDGNINVGDAVYMMSVMKSGNQQYLPANFDLNGDCIFSYADILWMTGPCPPPGPCYTVLCTCNEVFNSFYDSCDNQFPGDVNNNGNINAYDIDELEAFLCDTGDYPGANGDVNGDCVIDFNDIYHLHDYVYRNGTPPVDCTCLEPATGACPEDSCLSQFPGDADNNGYINRDDINYLIDFLSAGGPHPGSNGDVNGDCIIDGNDINILWEYYFSDGLGPVYCTCLDPETGEFFADSCALQFPGDANSDNLHLFDDFFFMIQFFCGGPQPEPLSNADFNGDCVIDSMDVALQAQARDKGMPVKPVDCTCQEPVIGDYFQDPCFGSLVGDANGDEELNLADAVYIINFSFRGGPEPTPYAYYNGDANCDCATNVGDAVFLINYIFSGGDAPCDCETWQQNCPDNCGRITANWLYWNWELYIP
ncbi:MAG: hypothetical protein KAR42_08000 [candidate division Zixibacteria bacterium]|nr:hypothetical protein [candidate division Zixibacteria bacterium]